jgi:hypothetical protein
MLQYKFYRYVHELLQSYILNVFKIFSCSWLYLKIFNLETCILRQGFKVNVVCGSFN